MSKINKSIVSFVIPVYNVEQYLPKCIDSCISQTYQNIEIILVDDGSTDNSGKICDIYASKDHRVKIIHKENHGVGAARNDGIKFSKGEYILFVDGDDYIEKNLVSDCVEKLNMKPFEIIFFGFSKLNTTEKKIGTINPPEIVIENLQNEKDKLAFILASGSGLAVWDKLYKTSLIKENQIFFDDKRRGQDFTFNFKIFEKACLVCTMNKTLYNYRLSFRNQNKFDVEIIGYHVKNYKIINDFFFTKKKVDSLSKEYLDYLFVLWFLIVIPMNFANAALQKKQKTSHLKSLMNSKVFINWAGNVQPQNLNWKFRLIFQINQIRSPFLMLQTGKFLSFMRRKFGLTN